MDWTLRYQIILCGFPVGFRWRVNGLNRFCRASTAVERQRAAPFKKRHSLSAGNSLLDPGSIPGTSTPPLMKSC
jgi:hypothetical protein